ncbi:MAG: 16S rRNA (cytosine(1402)-N(4))-methyltransferase RsmH [Candidatus Cloacimonetes bacterium]|nr:16S rRNA (cytosine(1402)-N(4))-methyltransferase RsmH [Candidatus Cloacimonadota bacterium]
MEKYHEAVFRKKAVEFLNIKKNGIYVDATLGGAGHSSEMFEISTDIKILAFDMDKDAIKFSKNKLEKFKNKIIFVNKNFSYLTSAMALNYWDAIDGIIFDLGVSSFQINEKNRGFSFMNNAKLDMRMLQNGNTSAFEVVNYYSEERLGKIIKEFGEEKYWKNITKNIVKGRKKSQIETTFELKNIVEKIVPQKNSIKSVARVFQAIRIEVNNELESLKKGLESALSVLKKGGRIVVISYHSLEDRIVKNFFKYENLECICPPKFPKCVCDKEKRLDIITKRPRTPSKKEIEKNPKARSAKLRVAERC